MESNQIKALQKKRKGTWKRRLKEFLWFPLALMVVVALCVPTFLQITDNDLIRITYVPIDTGKLDGKIRIAFLSDLHQCELGKDNERLVEAVTMLSPDIIAMGGDMIDSGQSDYRVLTTLCEKLMPVAPIYYSYGNHEVHEILFENSTLPSEMAKLGVHILNDRYETVEIRGDKIDLGGLFEDPNQFEKYGTRFIDQYLQSPNPRVLLVHNPGYYDPAYRYDGAGALIGADIDVALCGHLHGGQVVLPKLGGLFHPDTGLFPALASGVHSIGPTQVVVSSGLGNNVFLPRINNPPELMLLILS